MTEDQIHKTTKFFLDSCDPLQTIETIEILHTISKTLDGQTTNPSLLIKSPLLQMQLHGGKINQQELLEFYQQEIKAISNLLPDGSVSIEVYVDQNSTVEDLLEQANYFYSWIPNAHIKFPTITIGLEAAEIFVSQGGRVNMTLVFSQEQALAVHLATKNMKNPGDVLLSPFVGRFDDIGLNGTDFISNVVQMYKELDSKVLVLSASIRSLDHFKKCIELGSDLITAPLNIYQEYVKNIVENKPVCQVPNDLKPIPFSKLDIQESNWQNLNMQHDLTDKGLAKFIADWNSVLL